MYQEFIQWELVPTNQFGSHMASSTVDAGLCLVHDVQNMHMAGLRTGICLFDISVFFDNVNCPRLLQLIQDLGFALEIVNWCTDPPIAIHLWIPSHSTYYHAKATMNVQYLGFYINHKLNWSRHVKIMCNQALASLKSLQILGNSIYGINFTQWRLVYNTVCLPMLTYSCQLWFGLQENKCH